MSWFIVNKLHSAFVWCFDLDFYEKIMHECENKVQDVIKRNKPQKRSQCFTCADWHTAEAACQTACDLEFSFLNSVFSALEGI